MDPKWDEYYRTRGAQPQGMEFILNALGGYVDNIQHMMDATVAYNRGDQEALKDAAAIGTEIGLDTAGTGFGANMLRSVPAGSAEFGMFGGKNAKAHKPDMLADNAKNVHNEWRATPGMKPEVADAEAWFDTKWFWGPDGKPRFEIPDKNALWTNQGVDYLNGFTNISKGYEDFIPAQQLFDHPMFEAYPDLKNMKMWTMPADSPLFAGYSHKNLVKPEGIALNPWRTIAEGHDPASAIWHEFQHAIQSREGFLPGASPNMFLPTPQQRATMSDQDWNQAVMHARDQYKRVYGEAEARNVQKRFEYQDLYDAYPGFTMEPGPYILRPDQGDGGLWGKFK